MDEKNVVMHNEAQTTESLNGAVTSFQEHIDNLQNTRDISVYLDALLALQSRCLIILSTKDTPGRSNEIFKKIHKLGFNRLTQKLWHMYIGISDRANIIFNERGKKPEKPVEYYGNVGGQELNIISKAWKNGNISQIIINGIEYSLNNRGLNFVVFDYESNKVIDSTTYDSHTKISTLYHKNLNIDEAFFDNHFFMPQRYQELWRDVYRKSYFSNKKLNTVEVENGIIEPFRNINGIGCGGVCDSNFNYIAGHGNVFSVKAPQKRFLYDCYKVTDEELEICDETVLYGGAMYNHPGHLIMEFIAERLWWLIKNRDSNIKIAIVITYSIVDDKSKFIREFLEIMGIPQSRLLIIEKPTKFKKIIVPDPADKVLSIFGIYEFTKEDRDFFEELKKHIKPSPYKKIYLTKNKTFRGNIVGEEYLINFYRKKGFEIICPEDYTIREKAEFMLGADEVVSLSGTNLLFSIFCKNTVKLTILSRTANNNLIDTVKVMEAANIKNIDVVNVDISFIKKEMVHSVCFVGVTREFQEYVKKTYNEDLDISPEEYLKNNLYDYLKYCIEFYNDPWRYDLIKNQKMLTILQHMSEVFTGKDFDTSTLNLITNENKLNDQVKKLTNDLTASKKQIDELKQSDILKVLKTLDENEKKFAAYFTELKALANDKAKLQTVIDRQNEQIETFLKNADEQKAQISILANQYSDLQNEKNELEKLMVFAKYDAELAQSDLNKKKAELQSKESECFHLKQQIEESDLAVKSMRNEILELTNRSNVLQNEKIIAQNKAENLNSKLNELASQIEELNQTVSNYEHSRSWRITKPFRSIAWFFRKIFKKNK